MVRRISLSLLVVFFLLMPLVTQNPYLFHVLTMVLLWSLLTISLWLIVRAGIFSLGHAGFMAVGAYTSALLVTKAGVNPWLALPMAGITATIIAVLLGLPTLRVRGLYFAILTFAFGEVVRLIIVNIPDITGGHSGLYGIPPLSIAIPGFMTIDFTSKIHYYYLILILLFITLWAIYWVDKSQIGRFFRAVAANEPLSQSIGINPLAHKLLAFSIGCFFAGIGGAFFAYYLTTINPELFTVWESIDVFVYLVVGGVGSIFGPLIGASVLVTLPEMLRGVARYEPAIFGIILILVIRLLPGGLISLPRPILSWIRKRA